MRRLRRIGCFAEIVLCVLGGWIHTLKRRISGWTRLRGLPLTLTRPLPFCCSDSQHSHPIFNSITLHSCFVGWMLTLQWATAVAVFFLPKHCTL